MLNMNPVPFIFLKNLLKGSHAKLRTLQVLFVTKFVLFIEPEIWMSYDNRSPKDGTGAQLQRMIGIHCIARFLELNYFHQGLLDVSTHPLDPFQTSESRERYVDKVNKIFDLPTSPPAGAYQILIVRLGAFDLFEYAVKSRMLGRQYHLRIVEPFGVLDFLPRIYHSVPKIKFDLSQSVSSKFGQIVVHYRHGVGGFAKYHAQSISRQIEGEYYSQCFKQIDVDELRTKKVLVLTDAPKSQTMYSPPTDQLANWLGSPNFDGEKLHIGQGEIRTIFDPLGLEIEYLHGGDPLEALAIMANASTLIIGRSSLSYLGAILNEDGQIFCPSNFWHSPLGHWIKVRQ